MDKSTASAKFDHTAALAILAATPWLGSVKIRMLLNHFETPLCAIKAKVEDIRQIPGISPKILANWGWWKKNRTWQKNLELAEKQGVRLIPFTDPEYPKGLTRLPDFPILLYVQGEIKKQDQRGIAIVGTRAATTYGKDQANKIACDLASLGFTIVSGLARGIDTAAHQGALNGGRTIAVIGSGLANLYPKENEALAAHIANQGAVISEFPMETPPDRQNFPQRNRIVSAMSLGIFLIEAPIKSGAMITMEKGLALQTKLFALPGRADSENFRGNHKLIKEGKALLVENAEDIERSFSCLFGPSEISKTRLGASPALDKEELHFMIQLPNEELTIEEIVLLTKLPVSKLNILLMGLVLKKAMKELPGKIFKKT